MSDDFETGADVHTPSATAVATPEPQAPPAESPVVDMDAEVHKLNPDETDEEAAERDRDRRGRYRGRAKSQQARPEDVPRIRELTKKLRTVEQELAALKTPKSPESAAPKEPQPVYALPKAPEPVKGDPPPTIEQFANEDDPYGEWLLAKMEWKRKQEALQAQVGQQQEAFTQTAKQAEAYWAGVYSQHQQRLQAMVAKNPTAASVLQSVTIQPPPVLDRAIMLDPNSADVALYLASHPDVLDELALLTASQPVTQQNVEIIRRRLQQAMTAATRGSVASSPALTPAPKPPNPLRTGPMRTGESQPDPDDDSESGFESHAKQYGYGYGARRRRA